MLQTKKVFSVLEDFEIRMLIKILKKSKSTNAPKITGDVDMTPIRINFSRTVYNLIMNISHVFTISEPKQ